METRVSYVGLVRQLIDEALSEDEIRDLCFDHFPQVYRELAGAMSRRECIRRLVIWCEQQRQLDRLLPLVRKLNPEAYAVFEPHLQAVPGPYPQLRRGSTRRVAIGPEPSDAAVRPLASGIIHALPPAPIFVGRTDELTALQSFWQEGGPGVLALVGLGGAGKTALVTEFLDWVRSPDHPPKNRLDSLFVWSFYLKQEVSEFLESAYLYFSGGAASHGSSTGIYPRLIGLLDRPGRHLIVLDGLERVQRPGSDKLGAFGDLTDPLLGQLVTRLAMGVGQTKCVITTRFSLTRLDAWLGRSYRSLDIDQLQRDDARRLLRRRGVRGDDTVLDALIDEFGAHALTLDHLGGYIAEYCGGDPTSAASLQEPQLESAAPQERRLARVLHAYELSLTERERTLLARLCVFRFGTTVERLHAVFSTSDSQVIAGPLQYLHLQEFNSILRHLQQLHLVVREPNGAFTAHPAIRDHFYRSFADPKAVHQALRRHYSSLVGSPGTAPPEHGETLDLLEELVHHTLEAGLVQEAEEVYRLRLGGYEHLGWRRGQYSRCIRILEQFPRCPDPSGLVWCYRAVGDLTAALALVDPDDTWWIAMIGCLRGRLSHVAELLRGNRGDPVLGVAEVLTGRADVDVLTSAPLWMGMPISPAECFFQAGRVAEARSYLARFRVEQAGSSRVASWSDEVARYDLIEAEIARTDGELVAARSLMEKAAQWIVASGSQEHLCLLHLARAQQATAECELETAERAIREGLHVAEQCGFGLYYVMLRAEEAELALLRDQPTEAALSAQAALNGVLRSTQEPATRPDLPERDLLMLGAGHPECQLVWVSSRAGYLFARASWQLNDVARATRQIEETIALQRRLHDPRLSQSEELCAQLSAPGTKSVL